MSGKPKAGSSRDLAKQLGVSKKRVDDLYKRALQKIKRNILRSPELLEAAARLLRIDPDDLKARST